MNSKLKHDGNCVLAFQNNPFSRIHEEQTNNLMQQKICLKGYDTPHKCRLHKTS